MVAGRQAWLRHSLQSKPCLLGSKQSVLNLVKIAARACVVLKPQNSATARQKAGRLAGGDATLDIHKLMTQQVVVIGTALRLAFAHRGHG